MAFVRFFESDGDVGVDVTVDVVVELDVAFVGFPCVVDDVEISDVDDSGGNAD